MKEAAQIHHDFLAATLSEKTFEKLELDDPNEEDEDQKMIRMGYKYNLFKLKADMIVCVRCQINSYTVNANGEKEYNNLFVLPEWNEKRQGWSANLDASATTMLTKEITDNSSKFSRWTMQSLMDGVDKMKFAFIQRDGSSTQNHKVVGFQAIATKAFATQINLNVPNCWAVLKDVIETVQQQEESHAEYLYLKEPLQVQYTLRRLVNDDNEDEESSEDDGL